MCLVPGGPGLGGIPACTEAEPPVNRMTDRCKNITLPQTTFTGGKDAYQKRLNGNLAVFRFFTSAITF